MYYTSKDVYEFISKGLNDPITERKKCKVSGAEFPIYQSDSDFYDKISPSFNGKRYQIPTPTLCPEERQRRRLMFRNERKLYKRKCDFSGKDVISIYSPDKPYKVYDPKIRWGDERDPMVYGRDFDFNRTFLEQFVELELDVPKLSLTTESQSMENSEYTNNCMKSKDCYFVFGGVNDVSSLYGSRIYNCSYCMDNHILFDSERCYQCINVTKGFNCFYCINCESVRDSANLYNCKNCSHCMNCYNLDGKSYYIDNMPVSKEDFEKEYSKKQKQILPNIVEGTEMISSEQCVGSNIINSKNVVVGFDIGQIEDSKYVFATNEVKNTYDVAHSRGNVMSTIDCLEVGENANNMYYDVTCRNNVSDMLYSQFCVGSHHLFGCIGLRNKEYCIFNKQYTKEEYEVLVSKIIEHMQKNGERGELFNPAFSPLGYNETIAQEFFPLTREEAIARGYKRQDKNYDPIIPENAEILKGDQIPADISTVTDDILKKIFVCEVSGRPFRIVKSELEFYRKNGLPLPRKHPDVRHDERMGLAAKRVLYLRKCDHCGENILSIYPQDYQVKVYCENCFNREIYG